MCLLLFRRIVLYCVCTSLHLIFLWYLLFWGTTACLHHLAHISFSWVLITSLLLLYLRASGTCLIQLIGLARMCSLYRAPLLSICLKHQWGVSIPGSLTSILESLFSYSFGSVVGGLCYQSCFFRYLFQIWRLPQKLCTLSCPVFYIWCMLLHLHTPAHVPLVWWCV